jgi:hypothetical protein
MQDNYSGQPLRFGARRAGVLSYGNGVDARTRAALSLRTRCFG